MVYFHYDRTSILSSLQNRVLPSSQNLIVRYGVMLGIWFIVVFDDQNTDPTATADLNSLRAHHSVCQGSKRWSQVRTMCN